MTQAETIEKQLELYEGMVKRYVDCKWEITKKSYKVYGHPEFETEQQSYNKFLKRLLRGMFGISIDKEITANRLRIYLKTKGLPKEILWTIVSPEYCSFCFFPFKENPPLIRACECN